MFCCNLAHGNAWEAEDLEDEESEEAWPAASTHFCFKEQCGFFSRRTYHVVDIARGKGSNWLDNFLKSFSALRALSFSRSLVREKRRRAARWTSMWMKMAGFAVLKETLWTQQIIHKSHSRNTTRLQTLIDPYQPTNHYLGFPPHSRPFVPGPLTGSISLEPPVRVFEEILPSEHLASLKESCWKCFQATEVWLGGVS